MTSSNQDHTPQQVPLPAAPPTTTLPPSDSPALQFSGIDCFPWASFVLEVSKPLTRLSYSQERLSLLSDQLTQFASVSQRDLGLVTCSRGSQVWNCSAGPATPLSVSVGAVIHGSERSHLQFVCQWSPRTVHLERHTKTQFLLARVLWSINHRGDSYDSRMLILWLPPPLLTL